MTSQQEIASQSNAIRINLSNSKYSIFHKVAAHLGWVVTEDDTNWDIIWCDAGMGIERHVRIAKAYQRINHFPGMINIYRKDKLAKSMHKMGRISPLYDFTPKTWFLPNDYAHIANFLKSGTKRCVIMKPSAGAQGRGIYLAMKPEQIIQSEEYYIVQSYLHRPLLIDGYKFDLRIYVLVISCDPLRILLFREGLCRFCTSPYQRPNPENLLNSYMHLTNYSINKHNEDFVKPTQSDCSSLPTKTEESQTASSSASSSHQSEQFSSKRSLTWLRQWLRAHQRDDELLWSQIADIVVKTVISAQAPVARAFSSYKVNGMNKNPFTCFELLGLDIILDADCQPHLLEVNHMPSFSTDSPLDHEIKFALIHNTFRLLNLTHDERLKWQRKSMVQAQLRLYGDLFDRKRRPQSAERHRTDSPATSTTSSSSKLQSTSRPPSSSGGRDSRSASPSVAHKHSDASKPASNDATSKTRPAKAGDKTAVPDEVTQYWQRYLENEAEQLGLFDLVFPTDVYLNQPTRGKQAVYDELLGQAELVFQEGFTAVRAFPPPICIDTSSRTTGGSRPRTGSKDGSKTRTPATATATATAVGHADRSSGAAKHNKPKTRIKQKKSKSTSASPVVMAEEPLATSAAAPSARPLAAMKLPPLVISTADPVALTSVSSTPVSVASSSISIVSSQLSSLTATTVDSRLDSASAGDGRPFPVPPSPMSIRASFQHASPQRKTSLFRATVVSSASLAPFDPIPSPMAAAASAPTLVPVAEAASAPSRVSNVFPDAPDDEWGGLTKLQHERMVALLRIAQVSEPSDATATDDDGDGDGDDADGDDADADTDEAAYHHHDEDEDEDDDDDDDGDRYDNDDNDDLYAEYDDSSHQEMSDTDDLLWSPLVTPVGSNSASFHGPQGHYSETICRQYGDSMDAATAAATAAAAASATTTTVAATLGEDGDQGGDHSGDGGEWAVDDEYPDQSLYISYVQEDDDHASNAASFRPAAMNHPAAAVDVTDRGALSLQHAAADNHRFVRAYAAVAPLATASPMSPKAVSSTLSSSSFVDDAKAMHRVVVSVSAPVSPRASPSKPAAVSVNASILLNSSATASFQKAAEGSTPAGSPAARPAVAMSSLHASPMSPPNAADLAGAPPLTDFQAQYSAYRAHYLSAYRMAQQPPPSSASASASSSSSLLHPAATTAAASSHQYSTYK